MRGSIYGYVVRVDTGKSVAGATVTMLGHGASAPGILHEGVRSTSGAGWFTFDELPAGQWQISAVGPVGDRGEASVSVFDNAITEVTLNLNGLQRWLGSALVSDHADEMADVWSDGNGDDLCEPPQHGTVEHWKPAPDFREPTRTGSVRGQIVRGATGSPVAEATISVMRGAAPVPDIAPMTDADGRFAMDGLPWGAWDLSAVDPEGRRGHGKVVVGSQVAEIVIAIGTARRGGRQ